MDKNKLKKLDQDYNNEILFDLNAQYFDKNGPARKLLFSNQKFGSGPKNVINDFIQHNGTNLKNFNHVTEDILDVISADQNEIDKILKNKKNQFYSNIYENYQTEFGHVLWLDYSKFISETNSETCHKDLLIIIQIYLKNNLSCNEISKTFEKLANKYNKTKFICLYASIEFMSENFIESAIPVIQIMKNNKVIDSIINADDNIGLNFSEYEQYFYE